MPRSVTVSDLSPLILSRRDLLHAGRSERTIAEGVRAGVLIVLRRGWYIEAQYWTQFWPEGRHLARVMAVMRDATSGVTASHLSAGVVWGLPLYRVEPPRVHLTVDPSSRISSDPGVLRHALPLPPEDSTIVQGIRCTTLSRTVFDIIRTAGSDAAIACADAAERMTTLRGREWDLDARASWRAELAERVAGAGGARGIRRARWLAPFADGSAQLPGESVSRLQLVRVGFAVPRLQVRVPGPSGGDYFLDFALDDVHAFGEFDGQTKYTDAALRGGKSVEQVLLEEKRREDWIRGTTQRRLARWGDEHIRTTRALAARLASFGIRPPR